MRAPSVLLTTLLLAGPAAAQELPVHACAAAVGTFIVNYPSEGADNLTRSLVALTNGGHVVFVDSGQRGGDGYAPFSDGLGRWRCLSEAGEDPRFHAVILDFTLPDEGDQEIGRFDLEGTVDLASGDFTGEALLSFFPLTGDPMADQAARVERFAAFGRKVVAPE